MKSCLIVLGLLLTLSSAGVACVNGVRIDTDEVVKAIAKAEAQLAQGKYAAMIPTLDDALPRGVRSTDPHPSYPAVGKARALAAIAVVRSGDTVQLMRRAAPRARRRGMKSAAPKQQNLAWALGELTRYSEVAKN